MTPPASNDYFERLPKATYSFRRKKLLPHYAPRVSIMFAVSTAKESTTYLPVSLLSRPPQGRILTIDTCLTECTAYLQILFSAD